MASFPVLTMIDRRSGAGPNGPRLADRPDAAQLERRARALAEARWSEHVWLTGQVSEAAFRAVYDALLAVPQPDESKRRLPDLDLVGIRVLPPPAALWPPEQWRVAG